jgi:hypothetical protein
LVAVLQMNKVLGNLVSEMRGFPGTDLCDPSLEDLAERVRVLRRQLGFNTQFKQQLRRAAEAEECALCKELIDRGSLMCRVECHKCSDRANSLRSHDGCIPRVRPGEGNRMCPVCRERRGFRVVYIEH